MPNEGNVALKALVIDEPWIGKILRGEKTWEMRKTACHHRGQIALIRKGSGQVVGTADVVDSLPAIATLRAYADAEKFHGILPDRQERAFMDGWTTPWVLTNARSLPAPVPYRHPSGAVIWVTLEDAVATAVAAQGGARASSLPPAVAPADVKRPHVVAPPPLTKRPTTSIDLALAAKSADARRVIVTEGNINNNHIYLPLDFFPEDALGGSNKAAAAARTISITFQPGMTVETDIDRTKRILRVRTPVGDFLARAGVKAGDAVLVTRTAPYAYTFQKAP